MTEEDEAAHVQSEEQRAFASPCPTCEAQPGRWCTDWSTMHYERWGYGSLSDHDRVNNVLNQNS